MAKEILLIEISETGARVVKRNINDIGKSADNTQDAIEQLKTALGGLISAKLLKDTIMLADVYANLMNRLRVVTASNYELTKAMEGVYEMTLDTRTSLEANIDLYSRVAINTKQMGFEIYDVLKFSKQLNHAIILSGVTAREAQWGMIQFSQALASNALRGDELRAVLEQLPVVTDVIARHFGVTRSELRLLGFQGRITAKEIIEAFAEAEEELAERFAKRLPTIDQGLTAIRSSVIKFIGSQDQAAQVTGNLAKILLWAAHNMDTLGRFAEVAAIVIGGVLLTNVLKLISSFKVLRLTIFMTHPVLMAFATAASLVVVYSDKVKIATDSTATLSDVVIVFGERWAHTFAAMGRGIGKVINAVSGSVGKFSLTFESVTMAGAKFIDTLLGGLTGLGFVMNNIVIDTWGSIQRVWNAGLTFLESINDHIDAFIETIGDKLKIFGIKAKLMFIALAGAVRQMLAGNVEQAKIFANAAVNAFKQGVAGASFDELFDKNLKAAQVQDSLAFAKGAGELTGETFGEAFERGFKSSDFIQTGMEEIFARAREIAAGRGTGGITEGIDQMAMTPIEAELFRDMTGDMEKLAASGEALNNIFF
ncbi:MAG: tape measure protein, partial [Candidatus Peribacteraceae bacterium]|nr:tape measure protein [Candidatus Peribacteraceae bacterium]